MHDIDWHGIAEAIRERRFYDIPADTWNILADKLEGKTKRRGRPITDPLLEQHFPRLLTGGMTWQNRMEYVDRQFFKLRQQGLKSSEAKEQIAGQLCLGVKAVEKILTEARYIYKIDEENFHEFELWCDDLLSRGIDPQDELRRNFENND